MPQKAHRTHQHYEEEGRIERRVSKKRFMLDARFVGGGGSGPKAGADGGDTAGLEGESKTKKRRKPRTAEQMEARKQNNRRRGGGGSKR